mmetsp:Transcript_22801/g.54018  ORF Transcript_22801/g.54018 Transcript_22801/m.54018 type:complete len:218 (-) Transcript_22801:847-1500(-)
MEDEWKTNQIEACVCDVRTHARTHARTTIHSFHSQFWFLVSMMLVHAVPDVVVGTATTTVGASRVTSIVTVAVVKDRQITSNDGRSFGCCQVPRFTVAVVTCGGGCCGDAAAVATNTALLILMLMVDHIHGVLRIMFRMVLIILFEFMLLEEPSPGTTGTFHGMTVTRKVLVGFLVLAAIVGSDTATLLALRRLPAATTRTTNATTNGRHHLVTLTI